MDLAAAGLREQAFSTHEKPLCIVPYESHLDAMEILHGTYASPNEIALIQGPALSGKSTLIHKFVDAIPEECAYAIVDGDGKNSKAFLESLLQQFGYDAATAKERLECVLLVTLVPLFERLRGESDRPFN